MRNMQDGAVSILQRFPRMATSIQYGELPSDWKETALREFSAFMEKENGQTAVIEQVPLPFTVSVESEEPEDAGTVEESRKSYNKRNRARAIELLLAGTSVKTTAELIGVNRTTVHEWLKRPDFKAEMDRRTKAVMERSNHILQSAAVDVSAALVSIALNGEMDASDRIRAISKILEIAHGISTLKDAKALLEQVKSGEADDADTSTSERSFTRSKEAGSETA